MAPLSATATPGLYYAPLPSNFPAVAVIALLASLAPSAVSASSSSDTNSSVSSPLHLVLSSALSSVLLLSTKYYPPAPLSCVLNSRYYVILLFPLASVTVVYVASVVPCSDLVVLRFPPLRPCISPLTPYSHLCRPSGSCI